MNYKKELILNNSMFDSSNLNHIKEYDWLLELDNGSAEGFGNNQFACVKMQEGWIALNIEDSVFINAEKLYKSLSEEALFDLVDSEYFASEKFFAECYQIAFLAPFIANGSIKLITKENKIIKFKKGD